MLHHLRWVVRFLEHSRARETLRNDAGVISSTKAKRYALPHKFVGYRISRFVAKIDVDDADVKMIQFRSAVRGVQIPVWSNDTRTLRFERVLQVHREKVLVL